MFFAFHLFASIFSSEFKYDVYQYFLPESDCTEEQFELAYQQITSPEDLILLGSHVATLQHNRTALRLAAYPAVGRIIGIIVSGTANNNSGVVSVMYGLAHSYSCRLVAGGSRGCEEMYSTYTWLICAAGIFLGSFLALVGHRFFKCSQLIFGFYLGAAVAYVAITANTGLDDILALGLAGLCGLVTSVGVLTIWWFLGIPVLSVLLPLLEVGVLVACAFVALPVKMSTALSADSTYWLTFSCITLVPTILLIAFTQKASIISCAVVGIVTVIFCVDYFTRSSLKYVIIDVVRRVTVPDFGRVYLAGPPFEKTDLFLVTCLLAGVLLGLVCQLVMERTKPPFPPSPYQLYRWRRIPTSDQEEESEREGSDREPGVSGVPEEAATVGTAAPVVGYILRRSGQGSGSSPRPWISRSVAGSGHQVRKRENIRFYRCVLFSFYNLLIVERK